MRLVDADAVKTGIIELLLEPDSVQYIWSCDALKAIDNAPTIDAIPAEWLIQRMLRADDESDMDMRDCISVLVDEWQKEQEAR